jgi:hypothetical protein
MLYLNGAETTVTLELLALWASVLQVLAKLISHCGASSRFDPQGELSNSEYSSTCCLIITDVDVPKSSYTRYIS